MRQREAAQKAKVQLSARSACIHPLGCKIPHKLRLLLHLVGLQASRCAARSTHTCQLGDAGSCINRHVAGPPVLTQQGRMQAKKDEEAAEKQRRSWILSYADQESSSEDAGEQVRLRECWSHTFTERGPGWHATAHNCLGWVVIGFCQRIAGIAQRHGSWPQCVPATHSEMGHWPQRHSKLCSALRSAACLLQSRHGMQGDTVVDEWDAWGDEREIARRKAERQRAGLTPLQRRQLVGPCCVKLHACGVVCVWGGGCT